MERWSRLIGVVALGGFAGCSLAMSSPDPARPLSTAPQCDTGKSSPVIDGFLGAGLAVTSLGLLGADESGGALVTGLIATAFITAAIHGNGVANDCRRAFADYSSYRPAPDEPRLAHTPTAPPRSPVPPAYRPPVLVPAPEPATINDAPPAKPAPPPTKPTTPAPEASDWSSFWTEVP